MTKTKHKIQKGKFIIIKRPPLVTDSKKRGIEGDFKISEEKK
jgi:hypothetical protein